MKKSIVMAMLGVAAGVTASYGQGTINFSNYYSSNPLVKYAASNVPVGKANLSVGSEFSAELAFFNGTTANSSALSLVPASIVQFGYAPATYTAADGGLDGYGAGVFEGQGTLPLTGTSSGEVVTVEVYAFNNGSYAAATVRGVSGLFNVTLGGGISFPASLQGTPGASFTVAVAPVPEPTTMALGGLGLAALMIARRKKA
jgi:hypothetical protein